MNKRVFLKELKKTLQNSEDRVINYLTTQLKILSRILGCRPYLSLSDKAALARASQALDPIKLEKTFNLFRPSTLYRWYQQLVTEKWTYNFNRGPGRPKIDKKIETLTVRIALENPYDGYRKIQGRLKNLGFTIGHGTVKNILLRNGIPIYPTRGLSITWIDFLKMHWNQLVATDFFTWEVLTPFGLVSYFVLFFIRLKDREVHIAGVTSRPNGDWVREIAENETNEVTGFLPKDSLLIHDRDGKYTPLFFEILKQAGVKTRKLPVRKPFMNAYAERFVRTIKEECLSKMFITSEKALKKAVNAFVEYYHRERCHQGVGNVLLFPREEDRIGSKEGRIMRRLWLGGLLKFYYRKKRA